MLIWISIPVLLVLVLGLKYYTAKQMRKLDRRLYAVKNDLYKVKDQLAESLAKQKAVASEEAGFNERIKFMNEIIQDIHVRLTHRDVPEPEIVISPDAARFG